MAKLSADEKYVTVEKGDTLSQIALDYLGSASKYKELAARNNISNPDRIYVGQKIYLTLAQPDPVTTSLSLVITQFGLQSDTDNELFVTWRFKCSGQKLENYEVWWEYKTAVGIWMTSSKGTTEYTYSTLTIPNRAKQVRVRIKPISKKYKTSNGKETTYFDIPYSDRKKCVYDVVNKPDAPSVPTVTVDENLKLTAKLANLPADISLIQFEVVKDDATVCATGKADARTQSASYSANVVAGGEYKVRCRAQLDGIYGDWSDYSNNIGTRPANPAVPTKCEAKSQTSIYVEWGNTAGAKTYTIEYTTTKTDFDMNDNTESISGITDTYREVTGLASGNEYFLRIKAVNDQGESKWSEIVSVKIGTGPSAPTTWSSTTTAIASSDESVTLYWTHNTEDNSSQNYAEVELVIEGTDDFSMSNDVSVEIGTIASTSIVDNKITYRINNTTDEKTKDKTHSIAIRTRYYPEGATIRWRVRTAGITNIQGEWSVQRTVTVYTLPGVDLVVTNTTGEAAFDTLTTYPFYISASVNSVNTDLHRPIGYHISIMASESYETVDAVGNPKTVKAGDAVYSQHFNHSSTSMEALDVTFTPGVVRLENGMSYTIRCIASMSSGITVQSEHSFDVSLAYVEYSLNAEINVNTDSYSASIRPYCERYGLKYYKVTYSGGVFTKTDTVITNVWCEIQASSYTTTGERVYFGTTGDGEETYYCEVESTTLNEDVIFSVYRREFDGIFTEIATGLDGADNTFVTDPHPGLDYARYRIVATDKATGSISYYDMPNYPVGGKAIIMQWDEKWSTFEAYSGEGTLSEPEWTGSLVKLPYNVDVSESHDSDVALVEYIGRKHPVSYYGTQLGEAASWSVEIPKRDEETLYALRRLAIWSGDVYVREPSGVGYWAHVNVSMSQKHCEVTIPVTIDITRVEGGA